MTEFSEEPIKPRDIPPNTISNNSNSSSIGGGSRASVLIAASASYSPNAINIQSSNPADPSYYSANGQGFTASATAYVTAAMFRMVTQTVVSLTASFVARIYAASGTSPDLPTGSPLATSEPVTWNEILAMNNSGVVEIPFTFDGTLQLQQGTNYFVCVAATSGSLNTTNYIWTYYSAVNTALNSVRFRNNAWTNNSVTDLYFSVIGSTTSGGGCTCDWNNVPFINLKGNLYLDGNTTQFIKIESHPYNLHDLTSIENLLRNLNFTPPSSRLDFASLDAQYISGNPNPQYYTTSLFQVNFNVGDPNTGICCTHHFIIRKDLLLNGMVNSYEGEIVLHGSPKYRKWTQDDDSYPSVFTVEDGYHEVRFKRWGSPYPYIPIRVKGVYVDELWKNGSTGIKICDPVLDGNGNLGTIGQVLTSQGGSAPIWQTPSGGSAGGVQKGSVTTNSSGVGSVSFPAGTFPSGYTPTIVCTAHDTLGRSITAVVTASSNTSFSVKTFLVDTHQHKVGQVYNTTTNPITIAKSGKHHHYAVGTTGTTSHRHSIPNQSDHSHGITNGNVGNYNTSSVVAGGTNHAHTYSSWLAATNTNNGGSHNHSGYTDNETAHAHTFATTTSGSGNTSQDADAEHTHTFSQIPAYMRETVMYTQSGSQHSIGATMTTQQQSTQVTELYTVSTVNTPIGILVKWIAV